MWHRVVGCHICAWKALSSARARKRGAPLAPRVDHWNSGSGAGYGRQTFPGHAGRSSAALSPTPWCRCSWARGTRTPSWSGCWWEHRMGWRCGRSRPWGFRHQLRMKRANLQSHQHHCLPKSSARNEEQEVGKDRGRELDVVVAISRAWCQSPACGWPDVQKTNVAYWQCGHPECCSGWCSGQWWPQPPPSRRLQAAVASQSWGCPWWQWSAAHPTGQRCMLGHHRVPEVWHGLQCRHMELQAAWWAPLGGWARPALPEGLQRPCCRWCTAQLRCQSRPRIHELAHLHILPGVELLPLVGTGTRAWRPRRTLSCCGQLESRPQRFSSELLPSLQIYADSSCWHVPTPGTRSI